LLEVSSPNVTLSAAKRWLYSWWPSRRLGVDPQRGLKVDGRYVPVSIANWKLIGPVAQTLLERRIAQPLTFETSQRLTVIIPFRDRESHLSELLPVLTATLRTQNIRSQILVVEQTNPGLFNRGRLLNIGMHFAADASDYYCLHDVDAVPVRANYLCPSQPLRLVNTILGPRALTKRADHYFSGAISIRKEQAFAANGFSNEYWGWGKEDDDFFFRLLLAGYLCYFDLEGSFRDLPNPHSQQGHRNEMASQRLVAANRRRRSRLLRGLEDPAHDGLNTLRYTIVESSEAHNHGRLVVRW
jgi:N-terminal region of glycosyl transferase group 7/N-terminal domain of galactosyltransferase